MSLSDDDHACPVCGGPMRLVTTIRRVPGEQTLVVQCRPYGLSTTETIDAPSRARARIDNAPPGRFSVYCGCGAGTSRQRAYKPAANGPPRASPSSDGRCPRVASAGELSVTGLRADPLSLQRPQFALGLVLISWAMRR